MKTIVNIFEGIFDSNKQTIEKSVMSDYVSQIAQNPDSEFSKIFYLDKTTGGYENGILNLIKPSHSHQCKIDLTHSIKKYMPKIKKIYSKSPIEIINSSERCIGEINGKEQVSKISAPMIKLWVKNLKNISLESGVTSNVFDELRLYGLEYAENTILDTSELIIYDIDRMPIFKNTRATKVRTFQIDLTSVDSMQDSGLDKLIDWSATISASGINTNQFKKWNLVELVNKLGYSKVTDIFYDNIQFQRNPVPDKCISGISLPNLNALIFTTEDITFYFTKKQSKTSKPVSRSEWYYDLL